MTQPHITVFVNKTPRHLKANDTLANCIAASPASDYSGTLAVAVNHTIVHRNDWQSLILHPGDQIEIFTFVSGG